MNKIISKNRILLSVVMLVILVCSFTFINTATKRAYAQSNSVDSIITDFKKGHEGWTLNDFAQSSSSDGVTLISGGEIKSVNTMNYFLMQLELGDVEKGFELVFGDDGQNPFTIKFEDAYVKFTNIQTSHGEDFVAMQNKVTSGAMLQIEVMGDTVTIGIMHEGQPFESLNNHIAVLKFSAEKPSHYGKIAFKAYEDCLLTIQSVKIYSLSGSINIETEHYIEPVAPESPDDINILLIVLLSTLIPLTVGGGVVVFVFVIRPKLKNKSQKGDN